ncbi:hypothetical protein MMC16_001648 [Acarospora aff. strigata]|nr:hypothetical protein [Acarospora aff. strigata]
MPFSIALKGRPHLRYCHCFPISKNPADSVASSSCRRKDAAKPPSYDLYTSTPSPPTSPFSLFAADDPILAAPRDIVPPRLPTARTLSTFRIPSTVHDAKADLDPTEWKPKSERSSEAFQYLSQFHRSLSHRPALQHRSTTSTGINTPSLSYTPTTTASSMSTDAPYSFYNGPLPPRHPSYSTSAKSIDLVTPHPTYTKAPAASSVPGSMDTGSKRLSTADVDTEAAATLTYEKQWTLPSACSSTTSSLKTLLYYEHMQGRRDH